MALRPRTAVDQFAVRLSSFVLAWRFFVIPLTIAAALFIGYQAQHMTEGNNYRVFFSKENPELTAFETFQDTYTKNDNIFFLVRSREGGDVFNEEVMLAVSELTASGWQIPYSIRVDSLTNFQHSYAEEDDLIVEDLIPDPSNLSPEEFVEKKRIALAEPLLNGQLIAPNADATAVNVVIQYPENDANEIFEVAEAARALRDQVTENHPGVEVRLTGVAMLNVSFTESGQSDFSTLVPIMFGVVMLLTMLAIRSISATIAVMMVVILSAAVAVGTGGIMRVAITPLALSSVIVVLTLAVADCVHILLTMRTKMRSGMAKREALIDAMRINFLAVGITSLTTIVGFMALNFSDAPPFRHLGNMSAAGIGAAWFLAVTLLPALISLVPFKPKEAEEGASGAHFIEGVGDLIVRRKGLAALFSIILAGTLIAQIPRIEFNDQWTKYFDERIPFRTASDAAAEYFGLYPIEFSVEAGEPGGISDPEYLARLEDFTVWLRQQEVVTHVYSISDIMKRLNRNLHEDDPAYYRLPDDRELAAQYLLLYELSLPYGLDLNDRINVDKSASRVTATVGNLNAGDSVSTAATKQFLADAEAYIAEHFPEDLRPVPTSTQVMFTFITDRNIEQMIRGTIIAVILISIIMMISLRSFRLGLLSLVPNALPILTAFGAWALIVGQVGFSIAVIAAISLGIVVDDTVHLMTKYLRARREEGLSPENAVRYAFRTVGLAIFLNTVILSLGFTLLMFSTFKVVADMGLLTAMSIVFALILDFLFLPALLIWTDRDPKPTYEGNHGNASYFSISNIS
ncbi:efflux RND transporter permease subunit [Parvularcula marina]|uniref:RND transporter n=1 Tax=Parvularcula marina TaxID=2292771 RepID=A0A371RH17_9PROT|nr:efflux RND transporter permease subunit [Parvularcula marina]RFB04715.1 RND transporter [Parvularcula marina]